MRTCRAQPSPGPFTTPWPTDDPGLSRAERRELQGLLILRGHDIGAVDGMLGEKSRTAIRLEQARLGQEVNGRGGMKLLQSLRAEAPPPGPATEVTPASPPSR